MQPTVLFDGVWIAGNLNERQNHRGSRTESLGTIRDVRLLRVVPSLTGRTDPDGEEG